MTHSISTTSTHRAPPLSDTDIIHLATQYSHHQNHSLSQSTSEPPTFPPFLLNPSSHPTLLSYLQSRATSPNPSIAVSEYVSSLLSLSSLHPSLTSLLPSLLLSYTSLFTSHKIPHNSYSQSSLHLFSTHLDSIPTHNLRPIIDSIISYLPQILNPDDTQILTLLPKCLTLIRTFDNGIEYVNSVIDSVIRCDWNKVLLVKMVEIVRDFRFMDKLRKNEFLERVFNGMRGVEIQDLPSLVYQLLVLASKGFSKREVIEGIVMFFGNEGMQNKGKGGSIMRQVEGTVMLHVNFAVKQDPSLGQEVLGLVKLDSRAFNHFSVAVILSIARVKRFNENAIGVLKVALFNAYKDYKFAKVCKWLANDLKEEYLQQARTIEKAVLKAVNESNYGREHILPSIVQFGFGLLEIAEEKNNKENKSNDIIGSQELGSQVLKNLFNIHDMARNEIIEQCKFRILSSKPEIGLPIIRLLGNLIENHPYPILDRVSHLKELLDYFTFMNVEISSSLITILLPLIKKNQDLQDYTILVLRKATFRREDSVRVGAINAIIDLILSEKQCKRDELFSFQESNSQASSSQQPQIYRSNGANLFQELSGLLQRSLYQQAKVREILYHGLMKLVLIDPSISNSVFDFLLPHFQRFYKEDCDVQLSITECVKSENSKACIEEPLDSLLSCISWILLLQQPSDSWACHGFSLTQDNEPGRTSTSEKFSNVLLNIRKFLRNVKLEDLLVNDPDIINSTSLAKERKKCCALILSGVIEVFLNTILFEMEKASDVNKIELEKELFDFINIYESLEEFIFVKKGNLRPLDKFCQDKAPFLATSSITRLFEIAIKLWNDGNAPSENQVLSFLLKICERTLDSSPILVNNDPLKSLLFGKINLIGPPLLKVILLLKSGPISEIASTRKDAKEKEIIDLKEHIYQALICLKKFIASSLCDINCVEIMEDFLSEHVSENVNDTKELFIKKTIMPLLQECLELSLFREVEVLCDIVMMICTTLLSEKRSFIGDWAVNICKSNVISNQKVAKSMISLVLNLSSAPNDLILAQEISSELIKVVGSEKNAPINSSEIFPLINKSTNAIIASSLLLFVESIILEMEWFINKLKIYISSIHKHNQIKNFGVVLEETLYSRTEAIVLVLSSFVILNLKDPQAEQFLKIGTKLYKNLAGMSKILITRKSGKQILPSIKYQKLVEITCRELTAPLYNFVAQMQKNQQESSRVNKGLVSKIKRENKCIPDLIYQIEDYEKILIQLSKATKVNLLRYAKRSTSRDFKILEPVNSSVEVDPTSGEEPLEDSGTPLDVQDSDGEDENEDEDEDEDEDEGELPNGKRARLDKVVEEDEDEDEEDEETEELSLAF